MDDLWILLADPHERHQVDGLWGMGLWRLAAESPKAPWVVTEPALARSVQTAVPQARLIVEPPDGPCSRLSRIEPERAGWLGLLWLRGVLPVEWREARSFGLRAGILGAAAACVAGRPHRAALLDLPDAPSSDGGSSDPEYRDARLARRIRRDRWIRTLQAWLIDGSDSVETPDAASAHRLEARFLPAEGQVRFTKITPAPSFCGRLGSGLGVLASHRAGRNLELLRALAALRAGDAPTAPGAPRSDEAPQDICWLAHPASPSRVRAMQDMRRLRLAERVLWQPHPWEHALAAAAWPWSTLFLPDGCPFRRPLIAAFLSAGGTVVVPAGEGDHPGTTHTARGIAEPPEETGAGSIVEVPWSSSALMAALCDLQRAVP